ncbi:MAG: hypothetical protein QXY18_05375, partial [Nitrososphaerota archaeon]
MSEEKSKGKISPSLIVAVVVIIILLAALVYYATLPPKVEVVPTTIVQTALKTETLPGTTIVRTEVKTTVQTVPVTPTTPSKKETIVIWSFPLTTEEEHKQHLKMMEEAFESKNPDIDLVFEVYPWQGRD